ncbi:MAG: hypothetical protein ABIR70_23235 [Bryobacteraceae bacterium]
MTAALSSAWRNLGSLGAGLLLTTVVGFGQSFPLTCNAAATPVTVRAGGAAERTSDLVVTCTGGFPTTQGGTVQPMTWVLNFGNATATSRPLATGWSDALLVIDEPNPANQSACTTPNGFCSINSTGNPQVTYDGSNGHPNIFQGQFGGNTLLWANVPFDPPGAGFNRVFRFTNLRIAAPSAGATISVSVAVTGQLSAPIANPTRNVAVTQTPITAAVSGTESSGSRLSKFVIDVAEQFGNVLKPNSAAGPGLAAQSNPGGVTHAFETGFYNPNLIASVRGILGLAGRPDNGTRVRVRLNSVPTTATVSAPLNVGFGSNGFAKLITADANAIGSYVPATSTALPNDKGLVTAVYEITQSSSTVTETFSIPFTLDYASGAPFQQSLSGDVSLGPVHASQVADNSPIPRFNNPLAFVATAPREPLTFVTSTLTNGAVGVPYTQTIQATGGLPPYTFSSSPVTPAPGFTLNSAGVLSGTPTTAGGFPFSVTVRDSAQVSTVRQFSLTIGAAGSLLQTSLSKLDFSAILGGPAPPSQIFRVLSTQAAQSFAVTVDGGNTGSPAPAWLQVTPLFGTAPGLITVNVNQTNLPEGSYSARVRVTVPNNPNLPPVDVTITMVVKPVAAKLESSVSRLIFAARAPSPTVRQGSLQLRNAGGGGALPYTATVLQQSAWITFISPASGTAGPLGTAIRINIDSKGLPEGIYRDVVRFTSAINTVDVPISLRIAPAGPLLGASPLGVIFSMREGARSLAVREVKVFNGEPGTNLPWTAEVIRGSEYFLLGSTNGVATQTAPGTLKIGTKVDTTNLSAGTYYGLIRISAPGAVYSPRYVVAVLQVRPAAQPADLDLDIGGLVFTGFAGGQSSRRLINLNVSSQVAVAYQAAASTIDGAGWLSVAPSAGTITSAQSVSLAINVDPSALPTGVYRGEVTIATADDSETVAVTFIVIPAALSELPSKARAATCSPNRMAVGTTGLVNNFSVPAGWPETLSVEVRDNCGAAVSNASVVARFSNGDPPMTLDPDDITGTYSGTWQPGTALEQANVVISALNSEFPEARATLIGSVRENKVPTLSRNGTIHNLDPKLGGLLSPGLVAQMYGTDLSAASESTGSLPLSTNYKGTTVLVGPYEAPLYYVSPGQLVVQLPSELPPNRSYPILVSANGALTIPDEIDVVAVQPGVAAFADGKIIAQHSNFVLVDSVNPAKRGEFLIMYLVGLGATNPPVASGAPSPGVAPLGVPTTGATVTIDGAQADVIFSGLTPFGVGLYQINFKVPDNARLNTPLEVLVKQGSYTANVTTLTVVP